MLSCRLLFLPAKTMSFETQHTIVHFRFCNHVGERSTKPLPLPKHKLDHPLVNSTGGGIRQCWEWAIHTYSYWPKWIHCSLPYLLTYNFSKTSRTRESETQSLLITGIPLKNYGRHLHPVFSPPAPSHQTTSPSRPCYFPKTKTATIPSLILRVETHVYTHTNKDVNNVKCALLKAIFSMFVDYWYHSILTCLLCFS